MNADDATLAHGIALRGTRAPARPMTPVVPADAAPNLAADTGGSVGRAAPLSAARTGPDETDETDDQVAGVSMLLSLRFLRSALRRRRVVWMATTIIGLLAGIGFLAVAPGTHTASAMLILTHDPDVDPARAMATDVSLVKTRAVAAAAIARLGLRTTPDALLATVSSLPTTSDLLVLTMSGSSDADAVRRLDAFGAAYLAFRGQQVSAQSQAMINGYQQRITGLQQQVSALTAQIQSLSAPGADSGGQLSDVISQRAQLSAEISTLQQSAQDETLRESSVVGASRVLDPAAVPTGGAARRIALALGSGLIGGAAIGVAWVLFSAVLTDRLRLRAEVATALATPVIMSVGALDPRAGRGGLRGRRAGAGAGRADADLAAFAVLAALGDARSLGVACVDNDDEARYAVAAAGAALAARGRTVELLDLTRSGGLEAAWAETAGAPGGTAGTGGTPGTGGERADGHAVRVRRLPVVPDLTDPTADRALPEGIDCRLVLADVSPATGAYHVADRTDRVLVVVTAGRSSAETLRTTADQVRAAALTPMGCLLLRTDPDDNSSGAVPTQVATGAGPTATTGPSDRS